MHLVIVTEQSSNFSVFSTGRYCSLYAEFPHQLVALPIAVSLLGSVVHSHLVSYTWSTAESLYWPEALFSSRKNYWQWSFWILHLVAALKVQITLTFMLYAADYLKNTFNVVTTDLALHRQTIRCPHFALALCYHWRSVWLIPLSFWYWGEKRLRLVCFSLNQSQLSWTALSSGCSDGSVT